MIRFFKERFPRTLQRINIFFFLENIFARTIKPVNVVFLKAMFSRSFKVRNEKNYFKDFPIHKLGLIKYFLKDFPTQEIDFFFNFFSKEFRNQKFGFLKISFRTFLFRKDYGTQKCVFIKSITWKAWHCRFCGFFLNIF